MWSVSSVRPSPSATSAPRQFGDGEATAAEVVVRAKGGEDEERALRAEPGVGEFRVGVCIPRRKQSTSLIAAFWETLEAGSS